MKNFVAVKIPCPITGREETVFIYRIAGKAISNGCDSLRGDPRCSRCAEQYVMEYTEHWPVLPVFNDPMPH